MSAAMNEPGFTIVPGVLTPCECDVLSEAVDETLQRQGGTNLRNLLRDVAHVASIARSAKLMRLIAEFLGPSAFPVRALFFDKTPAANWAVAWHQDLAIAVQNRVDKPGFTGWSVKGGVPHVHPPVAVLERMTAVRLHLDDCHAGNGALQVLPGSHTEGKLNDADIIRWRERAQPVTCEVMRGGALVMRPLLLHASSPAVTPARRRVVHIEYSAAALPGGLEWFEWNKR